MADHSSAAGGVLHALRPLLTPAAAAAGFTLMDASPPGTPPKADIGLLEYRADRGGRHLLLDLYEDPAGRTVVAELWDPARLRAAAAGSTTDEVAERRLTWHRPPSVAPEILARAIAAEVIAWLAAHGFGPRAAPRSRDVGDTQAREVIALEARLARHLEDLQRQLARYASFDDPGAAECADRIAAVALAIEELDALLREEAAVRSG